MWHWGFVENVVCDESDQKVFRDETGWEQWLVCSGSMSTVRRPRFYWVSSDLDNSFFASVETGPNYKVARMVGPLEDLCLAGSG